MAGAKPEARSLGFSRTIACTHWMAVRTGSRGGPALWSRLAKQPERVAPMDYLLPIVINLVILALIWGAGSDWLRRNEALRPRPHHHDHH